MKKTAYIFLVFIILLTFSMRACSLMEPVTKQNHSEHMVEIKKGMSGKKISALLAEKGIIKSELMFYILLRVQEVNDLKSGYYKFSTSAEPLEIIKKLRKGEVERFKITIPEGYTFKEIINKFSDLEFPDYDGKILTTEINKKLNELPDSLNYSNENSDYDLDYPAEGIIIPTTYHFPFGYTEAKIADYLIDFFIKERLPLLKEGKMDYSDYSAYEILIIASLIEEEGKIAQENEIIASVIYNRLEIGMPLQLDATVQYSLEQRTKKVLYSDLKTDSPYNTYKVKKLPPTPIASPGDQAVAAAVNPADTEYFFYFAREDGSHVFTESYQEHLKKQKEIKNEIN